MTAHDEAVCPESEPYGQKEEYIYVGPSLSRPLSVATNR